MANLFFFLQDLPILFGLLVVVLACLRIPGLIDRTAAVLRRWAPPAALWRLAWPAQPFLAVAVLAGACGLIAWGGTYLVYDNYALSMDEFMANFDADILAHGRLMANVPPAWRGITHALHPIFVVTPAGGAVWASVYLPVNAALRAAAGALGLRSLVNPLLAAWSIVAQFAVGRKLWPDRPNTALIAAVLLASSSQLLGAAMTAYAMTAHLAFNLTWLWLFLRGGRLGHAGAILAGALACGLHQIMFHPLFVAPFILQLWLDRRWPLAGLYTLAYAGIGLFWIDYGAIALASMHLGQLPLGHASASPGGRLVGNLIFLLRTWDFNAPGLMARNLIRFATWQNILVAPLCVMGAARAWRAGGTLRALIAGLVLTLVADFLLMPYQGHGWGYRYLHGLLGSACLVAAWTWTDLMRTADAAEQARNEGFFMAATAASTLILFPLRAWQMHAFVDPYARASAYVESRDTDVVILDDTGQWYTIDLLRTDTYRAPRPLVLLRRNLTIDQLRDLCARYTISYFDQSDARRFGIRTYAVPIAYWPPDPRVLLHGQKCGASTPTVGP